MKKFLILVLFLFATNLYSTCCLTSFYDSLYFKTSTIRSISYYFFSGNMKLDESVIYDSTTCDSFFISLRHSRLMKGGLHTDKGDSEITVIHINGYVDETSIILKCKLEFSEKLKVGDNYRIFLYAIRTVHDTVLNYCKPIKAERKSTVDNEKILSVSIYDIRGRLVAIRNDSKFNDLQGFYVFKYITDRRTYTQKKYFIK